MSDVILIHCPILLSFRNKPKIATEGDELSNPPLGIMYIASSLEKAGYSVKLLDVTPMELTLEDILETIRKEHPLIVGLSTLTPGTRSAVIIASAIKKEFGEKIKIGVGGAHVNSDPQFVDRYSCFDFSIIGEAEVTFIEIIEKVKKGNSIPRIIHGEITDDLDSLPPPARHLIDPDNYVRKEMRGIQKPVATMLGSRGCPFRCIFCSRPSFRRKTRFRSPLSIVSEMVDVYSMCGGQYSFVDDTLTLQRENFIGLCNEITRRGLKVSIKGMTRATSVDDEIALNMAKAGFDDIFIGVESGNERIRNEVIKKNVSNEKIFNAIKTFKKHGIHTNIFLMLGFPEETLKEVYDTVNFPKKSGVDLFGIRITVPLPGSDLYTYATEKKMIPSDLVDRYIRGELGEGFTNNWPLFIPEGLTLKDLVDAKKHAYRKFYLNPAWIIRRIKTYTKDIQHIKEDVGLFRVAFHAFLYGKTKGSMS